MAAKFVVFTACLALAAGALVRRDAGAATALQDLEKHAAEFQKTISSQFNALANSKNTKEFTDSLKSSSDSVLQHLSTLSSSLQGALADANGKAKEALESSRQSLERSVAELRRAHPDVEQNANQLRDKISSALQNAAQETQKLAKEVSANIDQTNQKLAPTLKKAYDDFVKQAEAVQKQLHEAATKQ